MLGHSATALGVIQALASTGVSVIYLSTSPEQSEYTHFSRFISEFMKVPSSINENDKLFELLMETQKNWDGALLISTTDQSVAFVSQNKDKLSSRYNIPVPKWDIVKRILNKDKLYLQAQKIGVPTPRFFFPDSVRFLIRNKEYLHYPCILKPFQSWRFVKFFKKKVLIVHDFHELIDKYMETQRHNLDVMVSEIIPGPDSCFYHYRCYLDGGGSVLAELCTQKLQQRPPVFGVARVSKTIPMNETLRQLALGLLKSYPYSGVSSTEFKFDSRDNQFKLIEINIRPVLPERLFVAAGINFPYIAYLDRVAKVKTSAPIYATEIYWIDLFAEIAELLRMLAGKKMAIGNYLWPYRKKKRVFCIPFVKDPIPFIVRCFDFILSISKHIIYRLSS